MGVVCMQGHVAHEHYGHMYTLQFLSQRSANTAKLSDAPAFESMRFARVVFHGGARNAAMETRLPTSCTGHRWRGT